jgi:thymidylate kinase
MKIVILEGIATSGKTSVIEEISKVLKKRKAVFLVISETETLLPLLDNTDKCKSIDFLKNIVKDSIGGKNDIIIFDRLFFTHIFRTNSTVKDFSEIEKLIEENATLVLLKIDETKIPERIKYARKHRDEGWNKHIGKKGSEEETNNYYIAQQRLLLRLIENSSLDRKIYDTSNLDFSRIANDIVESIL